MSFLEVRLLYCYGFLSNIVINLFITDFNQCFKQTCFILSIFHIVTFIFSHDANRLIFIFTITHWNNTIIHPRTTRFINRQSSIGRVNRFFLSFSHSFASFYVCYSAVHIIAFIFLIINRTCFCYVRK